MHVVQEFDVRTDGLAHVLDHLQGVPLISARIEVGARGCAARSNRFGGLPAVQPLLDADEPEPGLHELDCPIRDVCGRRAVGVHVDVGALAGLPAEQVVDRHPGPLALDVPQRLVDAGDRVVEDRPVSPVSVDHRHLPDLLDPRHVAPDQERLEVSVQGRGDRVYALGERRTPDAVESVLRGQDLDDGEARPTRSGEHDLDVFDGHRSGHVLNLLLGRDDACASDVGTWVRAAILFVG